MVSPRGACRTQLLHFPAGLLCPSPSLLCLVAGAAVMVPPEEGGMEQRALCRHPTAWHMALQPSADLGQQRPGHLRGPKPAQAIPQAGQVWPTWRQPSFHSVLRPSGSPVSTSRP